MRSEDRFQLNDREQRYIENRMAGHNKTRAALNAGYSEPMAKKAGLKIEKAHVRDALQTLIRKHCPPDKLARVLSDAMNATTAVMIASPNEPQIEVLPDHRTRLKAAEIAARLGNMEPETKSTPVQSVMNLNVFELPSEERRAMIRSLMAELGVDPRKLIEA